MTVGSHLRKARTDRKLSLSDVTQATKIQPWILEAIEGDRPPEGMNLIYVKGFISTYARFLHLDAAPLLEQLRAPEPEPVAAAAETEAVQAQAATPPPAPARSIAKRFEPRRVQLPSIRLPSFQMPSFRLPEFRLPDIQWPRLRLPDIPAPVLFRVGKVVAVTAIVAGIVAINPLRWASKISLPKFSTAASKTPAKKAQAKRQAPSPNVVAEAEKEAKKPVPVRAASVTPVGEPLKPPSTPTLTLLATQPLELTISANRTTWIRVRADGKLLTQQRLSRGANERWTAKKQFEVVISKPNQVDVSLNGQPIGPLTAAHQGRVLITHQGITKLPEQE
jgi:cytoskeleton protein RodZ